MTISESVLLTLRSMPLPDTAEKFDFMLDIYRAALLCESKSPESEMEIKPARHVSLAPRLEPESGRNSQKHPVESIARELSPERNAVITGSGSKEKKAIAEKLDAFRKSNGIGSFRILETLSNGVVTQTEIRAMSAREPYPIAKWRVLGLALDAANTGARSLGG